MLRDYIPEIDDFTEAEKTTMLNAFESNDQLAAYKVQETIYKAFGKPNTPAPKPAEDDEVPF